ncbi:putative FAD-linked oxidoreductase [bacterium BMS3Abin05]|nr:putative FAD-linked oxidoreductase [bacterium BMS3Abin05]HDZ12451.1 FAD-binding oxidoreductase [Bacteroidota bacterium]
MGTNMRSKWWGWGAPEKSYDLSRKPYFWPYLNNRLDIPENPFLFPPSMEKIDLPPTYLPVNTLNRLKSRLPPGQIFTDRESKLTHTYGKSYHDLIRIRRAIFPVVPDAVVYPETEEDIQAVLRWAKENGVGVIPWGGGTSVVGGVEAFRLKSQDGLIVIDLRRMNRILKIHKESLLADVQAGIFGPELEEQLQEKGVTLAHYPESFEYSTLGGWIAARSAGQQSTRYGKMEDMVESVRLITPAAILETPCFPAAANGPDINQIVVGSEGILGVLSQARIRLKVIPGRKFYTALLFRSFEEGVEAVRKIMQSGIKPATVRLSDADETEFVFALREAKSGRFSSSLQKFGMKILGMKGFLPEKRAFLILGLEGEATSVRNEWRRIVKMLHPFSPFKLGEKTARQWYDHRFENPYLRDTLMNYDLLVDTLETATEWENLWNLYRAGRTAVLSACDTLQIKGIVTVHLSHAYPTGSSLYFIILAVPHVGKELEEWWKIKKAASDAIVSAGGTISHHHGIGLDHRPWLKQQMDGTSLRLLRQIKQTLDPNGIMNPGKLLPD